MRYILLLVVLMPVCAKAQQDPLYNQYLFNQLMINPAYAGIYDRFSAALISRAQWAGIDGAPRTNTLAAHTSLLRGKIGAGLLIVNDRLGINNNIEIQGSYSYKLVFANAKLAMGIQAGMIRYSYDYNELNLDITDDPLLSDQFDQFTKPNFGFGIMYMNDVFFLGVSVPRILTVEVDDTDLTSTRYENHYYMSGGVLLSPSDAIKLKITSLLKYTSHAPLSIDATASVLMAEFLWVGLAVRNLNTAGLITTLEISDQLRFGYSFELPVNSLNNSNYGTHEFSLSMDLDIFSGQRLTRKYF